MAVATHGMVDVASTLDTETYGMPGPKGQHRGNDGSAQGLNVSIYDPSIDIHVTCIDGTQKAGKGTHRHHHNFDQIRMMLDGYTIYDRQRVGPGNLQYVPESTFYGPQDRQEPRRMITFQFPGQSIKPFFDHKRASGAAREMKELGIKFENDMAIHPDGRTHDGWEAMWEYMAGRKIDYAPELYGDPIYFHTPEYEWTPTDIPGISVKEFGRFNIYGPNMGHLKLEPGAVTPIKPVNWMQFRVVIDGEAEAGGKRLIVGSRVYEGPGSESLPITSKDGATLLVVQIGYRGKTDPAPVSVI